MPYSDPAAQREANRVAMQRARAQVKGNTEGNTSVIPVVPGVTQNAVIPVIPEPAMRHIDYIVAKTFRAMTVADLRRSVPFLVKLDGQVVGVTRIDVEGAVDVT